MTPRTPPPRLLTPEQIELLRRVDKPGAFIHGDWASVWEHIDALSAALAEAQQERESHDSDLGGWSKRALIDRIGALRKAALRGERGTDGE